MNLKDLKSRIPMKSVIDEFCQLVRIDSHSGEERNMSDMLCSKLEELDFKVKRDGAGRQFDGQTGNIVGRLEGEEGLPPIILCAHMDRVAPGRGVTPIVSDKSISSSGDTVLGADDVAGIVSILSGIRLALDLGIKRRPLEVVFTASEENGLLGAKHMDYSLVKSKLAYVFDGAKPVGTIITASPTHIRIKADMKGRSAHAANNPEDGISAIQVAAEAITRLPFGKIDEETTANMGVIEGGIDTNIVCERATVLGEVRSLAHGRALDLAGEFSEVFKNAAEERGATAEVILHTHYMCYKIPDEAPVVAHAVLALSGLGLPVSIDFSMGGSDANMFNANGIESVCLGMGFRQVHSCREEMPIEELANAICLVYGLVTVKG